jgi:multisubunit Na+/H+ antiporter MnhB subunit
MHFRMVNHLLGDFFLHKAVKETAANLVGCLVVLVFDDTVPNVNHNTLREIVIHFTTRTEGAAHSITVVLVKFTILIFKVERKDVH